MRDALLHRGQENNAVIRYHVSLFEALDVEAHAVEQSPPSRELNGTGRACVPSVPPACMGRLGLRSR